MKKVILYVSLAFNAYAFCELFCWVDFIDDCTVCTISDDSMTVACPCNCIDTYRYTDETDGGGAQIGRDVAQAKLNKFHEAYPTCSMSGAWVSKRNLDALFCADSTWNGVYCYMGMNDDETYTMIFEGNHFKGSKMKRDATVGMQFFEAETLCPDWCGEITPH